MPVIRALPRFLPRAPQAGIHVRFIAPLKRLFKSTPDSRVVRIRGNGADGERSFEETERAWDQGRAVMAYLDVAAGIDIDVAAMTPVNASGEVLYELGMMYAAGRTVQLDLVLAHKWFNLAAMRGNDDAKRYRFEISREMSKPQISRAQRLAREWIATH